MYSFYNGGFANHFGNYFAEIASVHKYQTRLASLQKYYLPRMKTTLGQLSLKYIGPKIWSNKNWNRLRLIHLAKNIKVLLSCQTSCWSSFYMLVTFCLIFVLYACHILQYCADATIFPPIYLYSYSPHPQHIGMLFPTVFCCCFSTYFTWRWFDAFYYFYYFL